MQNDEQNLDATTLEGHSDTTDPVDTAVGDSDTADLDPSDTLDGPLHLHFDIEPETIQKVLVVDDEVHILKAVRRLFLGREYTVMTAEDGEQALDILRKHTIAVLVSDQRMPGMSGTELLDFARKHCPNTIRIMLTGNNDVTTAINAINDGEVFRFITKPWDHDNFLRIIDLALEQYELLHSREIYERKIESQNKQLRQLNNVLEDRVEERTRELQGREKEIARLYRELQHSFDGMLKAMLCIMELGDIHVVEHCQRTAERVRMFATHVGLEMEAIRELERAALLHWVGLINASASLFQKPIADFDAVEEATWEFHPLLGQQAVRHVPALAEPGRIILHYLRRYDDSEFQPGKLAADEGEEPLTREFVRACQILAICSTFEQMRTAAKGNSGSGPAWSRLVEEGLRTLTEGSGGRFDPELVEQFRDLVSEELSSSRNREVVIDFDQLEPGMVLARPLETAQGIPVAPRDMIITSELITRLERFRDSNGLNVIHVWD